MNNLVKSLVTIILFSIQSALFAQIENVIVENYYVSDSMDATDTVGGKLEVGSKTYRIFIDLKPGSKLKKIFGSANHPLKFASTTPFFNNKEDGQTFAKDLSVGRYGENTVALDTWLTIGQTTRSSTKTNFGIIKTKDRNGSFIGGINNDGGSAEIIYGLLTNKDVWAGIPLTTSDGMDTMSIVPTSWVDSGFKDQGSGKDTSIFGSENPLHEFISYNAYLSNSGTTGVIGDGNQILIAQLTTTGNISFELNLEIVESDGVQTKVVTYVANDSSLSAGEIHSPFLKYPFTCGCQDPDFMEAQKKYPCEDNSACKTKIVFGCMDSMACNYNQSANFNIQTLCCYVGHCNDLNINEVCPNLKVRDQYKKEGFVVYPNPSEFFIALKFDAPIIKNISYQVYDSFGREVMKNQLTEINQQIDISRLVDGIYFIRIENKDFNSGTYFIKG